MHGLTETVAPVIIAPAAPLAPCDPATGALSAGKPVPRASVRIVSEDGKDCLPGEAGEIVIKGPSVVAQYWRAPEETAAAMRAEGFRSGDVGVIDEAGWLYLVDRKKDMIVASGFKVWPREVEDVLYSHPAVREAAVVGIPDAYRGETVKAVVSLHRGHAGTDRMDIGTGRLLPQQDGGLQGAAPC
jgi:long-chain acyl-CoA synthetase